MNPFRRTPRSVRFRLTAWNVSILAMVILTLGIASHYVLQGDLIRSLDRQMLDRGMGMVRALELAPADEEERRAAWQQREAEERARPPRPFRQAARNNERNRSGSSSPHRPRALTLTRRDYMRLTPEAPYDEASFQRAAETGEIVRVTTTLEGDPVRILSLPVRHEGRVDGVVQIVRLLSDYQDALRASSRTLLMLTPFALLLSGFVGAFLTGRALLPVRTLRHAADQIQEESLSHRLPVVGGDEFAGLAETINDMLDRLERAFRQQARFTADASHELRTPLTVLRGNISLALARPRSAEEYRETLERVHQATERMSGLVEDLLLLARADASQLLTDAEEVPLSEILITAAEALHERAITFELPSEGADLRVYGNHRLLITLFTNLLTNAHRHTPAEGAIGIRAVRHQDSIAITVHDTGEGIPPEHLPHILDRFYRVDDSRSSGSGGAGLGLAICQSIARAHGGSLEVHSAPGEGTAATVTLPLA
ncbi:MAG TPA: HAMP domain-containing protein [Armatimonadetes bacterium]|jgi:heavy metal sensor kinase|nr:HAMP domain-containing protein [Armatimonadota bacterium]